MANRLKKLADARYTPGTPYQPYVPGYCIRVPYTVPGYYNYTVVPVRDSAGNILYFVVSSGGYTPPSTRYREVCYPAQPAVAAVAPTVTYTAIIGWNGGGRSVDQLNGDGYFEFQINDVPSGVVVGFSSSDTTTLPVEQTHAVYAHGTTLDIMENGVVVHTAGVAHDYDNLYRIQRVGLTVTYSGPGWSYESLAPSAGAVLLDASIYASGDYVDNPEISVLDFSGTASGSLGAMQGYAYEGDYAEAYGSLSAFTGEAGVTFVTSAVGTLAALTGVSSEGEYSYATGTLGALTGSADGGYPQVSLIFGVGAFPSLAGASHGITGEVGTIEATLPAMAGLASEGVYGEVRGTLPFFTGYADSGWPIANEVFEVEPLLLGDYFDAQDVQAASISDSIELASTFDVAVVIEDAVYDSLALADSVSVTQALEAAIGASILLGNDMSNLVASDALQGAGRLIGDEPAQYAVNVLTSALTTYSGFNFTSFASIGQDLYGARTDGVYRARVGDDAGSAISAFVDFGTTDFGSPKSKSVEAVYFGVSTDGELYARMDTGLSSRLYRVVQRGNMMRAVTAKGVGSRMWNVSLEIVDATEFEMDMLEIQVGISSRRWSSR